MISDKPLSENQMKQAKEAQDFYTRPKPTFSRPRMQTLVNPLSDLQKPAQADVRGMNMKWMEQHPSNLTDKEEVPVLDELAFVHQKEMEQARPEVVPPSLEEDPTQASPLPEWFNEIKDPEDKLDAYISHVTATTPIPEPETPDHSVVANSQSNELMNATKEEYMSYLLDLRVRELKTLYKDLWWTKDIEYNNNKKNLANLIIEIKYGTQEEEN